MGVRLREAKFEDIVVGSTVWCYVVRHSMEIDCKVIDERDLDDIKFNIEDYFVEESAKSIS